MKDYNVALISHEFPPFTSGGVALNCYDLALSLSKNGVNTTVFSGKSDTVRINKLNAHLNIVRLPCFNVPPRFLWFQIQNIKTLMKMLKEYDIVHGVSPTASTIFGYLTKKLKKSFITTIHEVVLSDLKVFVHAPLSEWTFCDFGLHVLEYPLFDFLMKKSLKNSDHVIVCGSSAFGEMRRLYRNLDFGKVSVIYNGINFDRIDKVKSSQLKDDQIIFYGRLVWTKGILHLIRAVKMLEHELPDLNLDIFGDGPLRPKVKSLISKMTLTDKVHLRGYVPNVEIIKQVKGSTVVAIPSLYEVGPFISALEAMVCRKPLVTFNLPFTREFIRDMHNGVLCKPGDMKDLSEKLRIILSDKSLRNKLGQNAYNYVRKKHNWKDLVKKYIEVYERCVC